jgi:hypothetical protein
MWIVDRKVFAGGAVLAVTFLIVLFVMFTPLFGGLNAFEAADQFFNSIAKGSSNYFEDLRRSAEGRRGTPLSAEISLANADLAAHAKLLLTRAGLQADGEQSRLRISGDTGQMAAVILEDAEAMFRNQGKEIAAKYGYPERETLFAWWSVLRETQKDLEGKNDFGAAGFLHDITMRGVEVAYNFYGIEPRTGMGSAPVLAGSLLFYILYTMWWGYAILFLFYGLGMKMKAGAKKEV